MKHLSVSKAIGIALLTSMSVAGIAHAGSDNSIATAIGTLTAKPPASITAPSVPKMPDMPKMPEIKVPEPIKLPDVAGVTGAPKNEPPVLTPPASVIPSAVTDHMHMLMKAPENAAPSTKAFIETNSKMHEGMAIQFTGNADADFVKGMIPHHQGAVDMAKIELQYGKDPDIKKFAEGIIKAQTSEIDFMKNWLTKNIK